MREVAGRRAPRGGWLVCALAAGLLGAAPSGQPPPPPDLALFFEAAQADADRSGRALEQLGLMWRDDYTPMLVDLARFMIAPRPPGEDPFTQTLAGRPPDVVSQAGGFPATPLTVRRVHPTRARIIRFLERYTGQRFGDDLGRWREWMWARPYAPHPEYMAFKAALYRAVDPRMAEFFTGRARIRLDEIDWGGVPVNGIPPLTAPAAIPAVDAGWLRDSHVVFGLVVGGEARAYPKRILAWHEMAHDTVGGVPLTVVYCTLCGTVIPYRSEAGGRRRTFGTSGLLYRSNKLMFDEETMSLWSTLDGRPVVGPLAGTDLALSFEPVVTTTWGEWRRAHPQTTVVSIETGFDRDYAEGAAYRDYFATDRLMFRVPYVDRRLKNKDEVLGLLLPARGGGRQAVAFSVAFLRSRPVHHGTYEGRNLVVLTTRDGANRVYEAGLVRFTTMPENGRVLDSAGRTWRVTEEALVPPGGVPTPPRPRLAAFRAFWFGWFAQFPETELIK